MSKTDPKPVKTFNWLNWLKWFLGLNLIWLLLAAVAVWLGWRSYNLSTEGQVAGGIVVELVEDDRNEVGTDIYPVVEFDVDGETYRVRSENRYGWWNQYTRFPLGREVEMRYDPADPQRAEINSWWDIWSTTIALSLFTVFAVLATNIYMFLWWKRS